ncbi:hypothetical protein AgCh_031882 [Apium graveolens]
MKGHYAHECKNQKANIMCYKCGKPGHVSRECKGVGNNQLMQLTTIPYPVNQVTPMPTPSFPISFNQPQISSSSNRPALTYPAQARTFNMNVKDAIQSSDVVSCEFDVILGMDWLTSFSSQIDCKDKRVVLSTPQEAFQECGSPKKKGLRKTEVKGGKSDKGHISPDCKKNHSDTSYSEKEVNYALMANSDSSPETAELKVPLSTLAFDTDNITELRPYLKTIFISYRDQTLTCERLTSENLVFKKRNDYLEKELVMFHQTQKDRDDAFYIKDEVLKLNESLKTELEKEREIIRTWTNSGRTTRDILSSGNWKEGLGYGDDKNSKGTVETEPIVVKQKPKVNPVKFVTAKTDIEKSEVKEKLTSDKPK